MINKNYIKSLFVLNGIQQIEIAELLGIKQQTLSKKLSGKNSFKGHELLLIADVLGITTVEELKKFYIQ